MKRQVIDGLIIAAAVALGATHLYAQSVAGRKVIQPHAVCHSPASAMPPTDPGARAADAQHRAGQGTVRTANPRITSASAPVRSTNGRVQRVAANGPPSR